MSWAPTQTRVWTTPRWWFIVTSTLVALLLLSVSTQIALSGLSRGQPSHAIGLVCCVAIILSAAEKWSRLAWPERAGVVEADGDGIWLDGVLLVPRSGIFHGHFVERGEMLVRLSTDKGRVHVRVVNSAQATDLCSALQLDSADFSARYLMIAGSWKAMLHRGLLLSVLMAASVWSGYHWNFVNANAIVLFVGIATTLAGARAVVWLSMTGSGIRIRRLLGRDRFIPFTAVADIPIDATNFTLALVDGSRITMHSALGDVAAREEGDTKQMHRELTRRARACLARSREEPVGVEVWLARAGRSTADWVRTARGTMGQARFRENAVTAEQLWGIIEDPMSRATVRVGAALALSIDMAETDRDRLRSVALRAAPDVRAALLAISGGTEHAIAKSVDLLRDHSNSS